MDKLRMSGADGLVAACFDKEVSDKVVTAIAKKQQLYAVIRGTSMADDNTATNYEKQSRAIRPASS